MTTLFKSLDKQELFNYAYNGVIAQGESSVNENGNCRYQAQARDGAPLHCGVGHCMTEEAIAEFSDSPMGVHGIGRYIFGQDTSGAESNEIRPADMVQYTDVEMVFKNNDNIVALLSTIQCAHDEAHRDVDDNDVFLRLFKDRMAQIATEYKLLIPDE